MGRVRYQKPSSYEEMVAPCIWLADQREELQSKIEELRRRYFDLRGDIATARVEKRIACAGGKETDECRRASLKLDALRAEHDGIRDDLGRCNAELIVIELRMKKLKCEEWEE